MTTLRAALPAIAANAADTITTFSGVDENVDDTANAITECALVLPNGASAITANGTDHATFTVRQLRAGSVIHASVATLDTAAHALAAETPVHFTLAAASHDSTQPKPDDVFDVVVHQVGAGRAIPAGTVVELVLS